MSYPSGPPGTSRFQTTRWSVILDAGLDSPAALEELCATYWRPIHAFVQRRGYSAEEADDLTQGFFAAFLERRDVAGLDPSRGHFRAYLLAAVKHFLANAAERERALKRGAGARALPLAPPGERGEEPELLQLPADDRTPEACYERQWALALLGRALERLREERGRADRRQLFERLKPTLAGDAVPGGYAAVAEELGLTTVAVKVAAHRLRKRYRELLLEEVARTVDRPQEIESELQHLFRAVGA